MKKLLFAFLASVSVLLGSCKKENKEPTECKTNYVDQYEADTIQPSPYLMTYPGSVWHYDDGSTISCDAWVQATIITGVSPSSCVTTVNRTFAIVPRTTMGNIYFDSGLYDQGINKKTEKRQLLSTQLGLFYNQPYKYPDYWGGYTKLSTEEVLPSLEVNGVTYTDVLHIHMEQYVGTNKYGSGPTIYKDYWYSNGVGLIRWLADSTSMNGGPAIERSLVSYTIGPH